MEDAVGAWFGEGQTDEDEGRDGHDSSDSLERSASELNGASLNTYPIPVGAMSSNANDRSATVHPMRRRVAVGVNRTVAHCCNFSRY